MQEDRRVAAYNAALERLAAGTREASGALCEMKRVYDEAVQRRREVLRRMALEAERERSALGACGGGCACAWRPGVTRVAAGRAGALSTRRAVLGGLQRDREAEMAAQRQVESRLRWLEVRVQMRSSRLEKVGASKREMVELQQAERRALIARIGVDAATSVTALEAELAKQRGELEREEARCAKYVSGVLAVALRDKLDVLEVRALPSPPSPGRAHPAQGRLEQLRREGELVREVERRLATLVGRVPSGLDAAGLKARASRILEAMHRFEGAFEESRWCEAARIAALSPEGSLRTPDIWLRFEQATEAQHAPAGGAALPDAVVPLMAYAEALVDARPSEAEGMACVQVALRLHRGGKVAEWLARRSLSPSIALGDLLAAHRAEHKHPRSDAAEELLRLAEQVFARTGGHVARGRRIALLLDAGRNAVALRLLATYGPLPSATLQGLFRRHPCPELGAALGAAALDGTAAVAPDGAPPGGSPLDWVAHGLVTAVLDAVAEP